MDPVPYDSAGTRKRALKRTSERVIRSSDIVGSASDTDEYGSDTEPITTEEEIPEPENTKNPATEITQASKEPISEIVSSSPTKQREEEIKVPQSGQENKVKKEPLSPPKDLRELPYVRINLVSGPMSDRRLHLQVGYQPIIKAERMTEEAMTKWQNPERKSEVPDPAENTVTSQNSKETLDPDKSDRNLTQKDSGQSPVQKKYRGARKGNIKDKFDFAKDINVVSSDVPRETSVLDDPDKHSTQKNSGPSPLQRKFKGVRKESSKDKLTLSEDVNVISTRKNSVSTKAPVEKSVQKETKSVTNEKDREENKFNLKEVKIVLGGKDYLQKDLQQKEKDVTKANTKEKFKKLKDLGVAIGQKNSIQKESVEQKEDVKEYLNDKFRLLKDVKIVLNRESLDRLPKKEILGTTSKCAKEKSTVQDSETNDNIFDTLSRMRSKDKRHSDEIRSRSRSPSASRSRRSRSPSVCRSKGSSPRLGKSRSASGSREEGGKRARSLSEEDKTGRKRAKLNSPEEKLDKRKRKRELSEKEEEIQKSKKVKNEPSEEKKGKPGQKTKKGAPKRKYGKCPGFHI